MTYQPRFPPEVEADVRIGVAWYEERSFGLGVDLLQAFYAGVDAIVESPLLYRTVQGPVRRRIGPPPECWTPRSVHISWEPESESTDLGTGSRTVSSRWKRRRLRTRAGAGEREDERGGRTGEET